MHTDVMTLAVIVIVFFSTFVRAIFGFGNAVIAMPLLTMVIGIHTTTPLVALHANFIAILMLGMYWKNMDIKSAWQLILASLVGIPVGLMFLKSRYEVIVNLGLAVLILGFSLYHLLRPRFIEIRHQYAGYVFGFIAGILGGAYNTNGPPIIIYATLKRWPANTFRATLQGYFFLTGILITVGHGMAGLWTLRMWKLFLLSVPVIMLAIFLGSRLNTYIPQHKFDKYVYILLLGLGGMLLIRTLM